MKALKAVITENVFINLYGPLQEVSSFYSNWTVGKVIFFKNRIFKPALGFFQLWNVPAMEICVF